MKVQDLKTYLINQIIIHPSSGDIGRIADFQWAMYKDSIEMSVKVLNSFSYWTESYSMLYIMNNNSKSFLDMLAKRSEFANNLLNSKLYKLIA